MYGPGLDRSMGTLQVLGCQKEILNCNRLTLQRSKFVEDIAQELTYLKGSASEHLGLA